MRIHKGTYTYDGRPTRWIETTTRWEFNLEELIDGLCSHHHRNRTDDDDPLPEKLTLHAILRTVREQYKEHGTANTWTWSDSDYNTADHEEARAWARRLILAVLPDLEVPQRQCST